MDIVFIRHGSTDANNSGLLQGQTIDSELNNEGKKQIQDIIQDLKKFDFDLIFSSPLKRASQSAEIIEKRLGILIKFDRRIMEKDYGSLAGKSHKDASSELNMSEEDFLLIRKGATYDFRQYGVESSADVKSRIKDFLSQLKRKNIDTKILVVTHSGVIRQMHSLYSEEAYTKHESLPNASIHVFDV